MTPNRVVAALTLPAFVVALGLVGSTGGAGAASSTPPACANLSRNTNCVHAPTSDETAQPAKVLSDTYDAKLRRRLVQFYATIKPPYQTCPDGEIPDGDIPCTQRGLQVGVRLYRTDGQPAADVGGDNLSEPSVPGDCQYFVCRDVKVTMGQEYYGPGTLIVNYAVGNVIVGPHGPGALSTSDYEDTISLPADPTTNAVHILKGKKIYSGKPKNITLKLAGKGGIPHSGVGGEILFLDGKGSATINGSDGFGNTVGILEVVKGTKLHLKKQFGSKGTISVEAIGYYSTKASLSGDLLHDTRVLTKVHVAKSMSLHKAGVPADASAALLQVTTPHGNLTLGGVKVGKTGFPQYVMAPVHGGVLRAHAARGTLISVAGYAEPIHPYDEGSKLAPPYTEALSNELNLPDAN